MCNTVILLSFLDLNLESVLVLVAIMSFYIYFYRFFMDTVKATARLRSLNNEKDACRV
jgi:hypothetical protein